MFLAASLKGNTILNYYHSGAYGQIHQQKWSCCNAANRDTQGCQRIFGRSTGKRRLSRTASLRMKNHRRDKKNYRRAGSFHGCLRFQRSPSPVFYDAKEAPENISLTTPRRSVTTNNVILFQLEKDSNAGTTPVEIRLVCTSLPTTV